MKGLELTGTLQLNNLNHESWCVYVRTGNNSVFELLDANHNMGPSFLGQEGGKNTFLNCDSHANEDTLTSNGDGQSADGFGCHPDQTSTLRGSTLLDKHPVALPLFLPCRNVMAPEGDRSAAAPATGWRSTSATKTHKACIDRLLFNPDCTIVPVKPTL